MSEELFLWIFLKYKVEGSIKGDFLLKDIEKWFVEWFLFCKKINVCWCFVCSILIFGVIIDSYFNCVLFIVLFKILLRKE